MSHGKLKIVVGATFVLLGVAIAFFFCAEADRTDPNVNSMASSLTAPNESEPKIESRVLKSQRQRLIQTQISDKSSAVAELKSFILILETLERNQAETKIRSEKITKLISELENSEIVDLLGSREVQDGGIASFFLIEAIWRTQNERIEANPDLVEQLAALEKPSRIQGQFLEYLAKNSKWFGAAKIAKLSQFDDIINSQLVITGIRNRLGDETYLGGKGGKLATVAEYMSVLPDSKLRDEIYASGYLSELSVAELLEVHESIVQNEAKYTNQSDKEYVRLLISNDQYSQAKQVFNELLLAGRQQRAGSVAVALVHNSDESPDILYDWARDLPTTLPSRQEAILIAFRKILTSNPKKAEALISLEEDAGLSRAFRSAFEFSQHGIR